MKKKYLIILLLAMVLMPFKIFASGGFDVSSTNITMYPGESKTITISSSDSVGRLDISSSNGGVATANPGSIFIDSIGASKTFTITGNGVGSAIISVVGTENYASFSDEVSLMGLTRTITVNVIAKPEPQPTPTPTPQPSTPQPSNPQNNLSNNNNIKSISIDGYELVKVDNNNYTLSVSNDITSVSVNATAEDSKAKVTGTGAHELQVGENNIGVIITSESGAQNKINIKVIRKDGYYLEDLDSVLKNPELKDADIIINVDSKISNEDITKIKDSKKTLRLNYYDENKKLIYSWTINGKEIKSEKEFITSITYNSDNAKEIYKLSNYADGLYINFKHSGDLPGGTKIKLYIGDKFENESIVNVYQYNNTKKILDFIKGDLKVTDGYIEFDIEHCSEYFVTMSVIGNIDKSNSSINIFVILTIVLILIIITLVAFIFIKIKPNKKESANLEKLESLETLISDFNKVDSNLNNANINSSKDDSNIY